MPHTALHAVLSGEGRIQHADHEFSARTGEVFILRKGEYYRYSDLPGKNWHYAWFSFNGQRADLLLDQLVSVQGGVIDLSHSNTFWLLLKRLKSACEAGPINAISASRWGWEMLDALQECANSTDETTPDPAESARRIIESGQQHCLHVDDLADTLHISRSTLFRRFKQRYGISVKDFIDQVRFERAETLLRASSLSVKEIALLSGYEDHMYFNRVFKKRYHLPPGKWRAQQTN